MPNDTVLSFITCSTTATASNISTHAPRTELDSHANMAVLGSNCFVFEKTGKTCNVSAFSPNLAPTTLQIVDAVIVYDCPYKLESYLLMIRNALLLPEAAHNLIPPFLLREAGLVVNETAKIHAIPSPSEEHHSIFFPENGLRIPLQLNGIFSYFLHRVPHVEEIDHLQVLFLTPDSSSWDPHAPHYGIEESCLLDDNGLIIDHPPATPKFLITDEDTVDNSLIYSTAASPMEMPTIAAFEAAIDKNVLASTAEHFTLPPASASSADIDMQHLISALEATLGSTLESSDGTPFITHFDELETLFSAEISSMCANKSNSVSPEFLSKIWCIDNGLASDALTLNSHLNRQSGDTSLSRHFSTNDRMLRYKRINSIFYTDTFFITKNAKSKRGNTCMQIFVSDKGFIALYPMQSKSQFKDALHLFCKEIGVPDKLVLDPSGEQTSRKVKHFSQQVCLTLRYLEKSTQWANRAELYIGLLKEAVRRDLRMSNCPLILWDYCAERRALIHNLLPRKLFQASGQTPVTATLGIQGDISNLCHFAWYDWCYYREENTHQFPHQKYLLGRVLGPTKNEGNSMAQNILNHLGNVVPRRTLRRLTAHELQCPTEIKKRDTFDARIKSILGDCLTLPPAEDTAVHLELDDFSDIVTEENIKEDSPSSWEDEDPVNDDGTALFENSVTDTLISAEVLLPHQNKLQLGRVTKRSKGDDGLPIGTHHSNPMLNTATYDVTFADNSVANFGANVIAQNIYSQVDQHGHSERVLDKITAHSKNASAVKKPNMFIYTKSGQKRHRRSTVGWKLCVKWKDGSTEWIPLKLLKELFPVAVAEYAITANIDSEPAFAFWVPYVLKKRNNIIASVKARVAKSTHKYGIEVPKSVAHALELDKQNGNTFWADALSLEMNTINVAFNFLPAGSSPPKGYSRSSGHIIFDVKMDFTRKARWVKNGHLTKDPTASTYAGVVSRESVRILLTYAALNALDICAADVKGAYLQAPTSEKHFIICGPEFGPQLEGTIAVITRALYGGKSAGSDYWKHMRRCMSKLGFTSCRDDPDVWRRPATKPDGTAYYTYVCLYVDDCLCIDMHPEAVIRNEIGQHWTLKESSIGPPQLYLGNKVSKVTLSNNITCWAFSSSQYVQAAVSNVVSYLKERNLTLPKRASAPFRGDYRPEVDTTPELTPAEAAYYQSQIGVLRWIVELGRVDITCEVSELASMMAMPREGHMDQLYHIYAYLKIKHNAEMVFDPTVPDIDHNAFAPEDWSHTVYHDAKETLANDNPPARGLGFVIRAYVDADHAGNLITRRSRTGFIIFLNNAPIYWLSKRQTGIETSSFGSEFMAMKHCCEYLRGLRHKLRSMGIPVETPCFIYGDNKSVLVNGSKPDSVLQKKSTSIAYHYVREGSASNEWRISYINTDNNCSDMLSKSLPGGRKRIKFTNMILHHIYDYD